VTTDELRNDILGIAKSFSGRDADLDDRIYQDLGIGRGDFIEFVVALERRFDVDLDWVSPRDQRTAAQDPTLAQLIDDIARQREPG